MIKKASWGQYYFTISEEVYKHYALDAIKGYLNTKRASQVKLALEELEIGLDVAVLVQGDPPIRFAPRGADRAGVVIIPTDRKRVLSALVKAYLESGMFALYDFDLDLLAREGLYLWEDVKRVVKWIESLKSKGEAGRGDTDSAVGVTTGERSGGALGGVTDSAVALMERLRRLQAERPRLYAQVAEALLVLLERLGPRGVVWLAKNIDRITPLVEEVA